MEVFCDWFSAHQEHFKGGLPVINNGAVWSVDLDGQVEWTTERTFEQVGSYDTKIRIKCDGYRVKLDGNVGRFNRPDNVFGYSVLQCVDIANEILRGFGIPSFTAARFNPNSGKLATGATITRLDLTKNYSSGNHKNAVRLVNFMAGQDAGRRATVKQYGDNGVTWNEGSKYQSSKLYIKAEAIGNHASDQLKEWVRGQGIVRHEATLKARYLAQQNLQHLQDWKMEKVNGKGEYMENIVYGRFAEVLTRGTAVRTPLEDIPKPYGNIAMAWLAGKNVWSDDSYGRSTRQRWRKALLPYGIDIKQPSSVVRLNTRLEVISLKPVIAPNWYWDKAA